MTHVVSHIAPYRGDFKTFARNENQNRGIEASLNAILIDGRDFTFSIGGNIAFNKTKLSEIGLPPSDILIDGNYVRRAFYEEFGSDIKIKHEVITERVPLFNTDGTPRTAEVTKDDREHSQWYDRNTLWLSKVGK